MYVSPWAYDKRRSPFYVPPLESHGADESGLADTAEAIAAVEQALSNSTAAASIDARE